MLQRQEIKNSILFNLSSLVKTEQYAKQEKAVEIARIMLDDNEPNEKIARYTGLTLEEIEELRGKKQ